MVLYAFLVALPLQVAAWFHPMHVSVTEIEMDEKEALYGERYPIDEDFLTALAKMPPASGGALGFDRLVMLCTDAVRIDQVLWTPVA